MKGLRIVTAGSYGANESNAELVYGREDTLKVLAASNTILALVLVGILVIQAGLWYAERKEQDEDAKLDKLEEKARKKRRD